MGIVREQEVTGAEVAEWAGGLDAIQQRIGPRFARSEQRQRVQAYLEGLLSPVERKNGWQLAERAGEATPYGMQRLLAGAKWDADAVRDDLRGYVVEYLGDPAAVLVIDETGFVKQGPKSVGVKRQYSGTAGRIANCQIGVFLTYASPRGHVLLDRAVYLPHEWADDQERRHEAGVPNDVAFATKPELARQLLARALDAAVPAAWVTGDSVYGGDRRLRGWLEQREQPFVLAVAKDEPLWAVLAGADGQHDQWGQPRADVIAAQASAAEWQRLSAGNGAKGPRLHDWTRLRLARLQLTDEERRWEHWLLVRRSVSDPTDLAYYVVFAPTGTSVQALVTVAGQRWRIEQSFELAKGEVGLDHYEVRRWDGWYRHMTLAMFALAYLTVLRAHAASARDGEKGGPPTGLT
ncbi:MAG TPA: IS701 family transposase [Ktedonobacterales bacterium]|nr:IS701 family transposase [Ktedonobacterales bacterium]